MKKILFAFCLLGFVSMSIVAQPLTEEQKQKLIADLDSSDYGIKMGSISKITEKKVVEAIPKIEQGIWNQDPYIQYLFLEALWTLKAPSTLSFARSFYDTADTFKNYRWHSEDPLIMKVWATAILFTYGDYSKTSVVFDLLNRDSTKIDFYARHLLRPIIENVPAYAAAAKEQLIRIALQADGSNDRWRSFIDLVHLYGSGASDVLVNVARNDKEPVNRFYSLFLLCQVDYSLGHILLLERLKTEPAATYHTDITDTLFIKYGKPIDYKTVKECQQLETDTTTKSLMWFSLQYFKPPKPDSLLTSSQLIDSLESCLSQVRSYSWLGDQSFANELSNNLTTAKNYYNAGNQINCARQIKTFQQAVDREYRDSTNATPAFVTVEGWKFLYYNAQYILDRLPQIPPDPSMGSISPAKAYAGSSAFTLTVNGKKFVSGSTVNWNGLSKTTTFIADSILQASILASDVAAAGTASVSVANPDGGTSNSLSFVICPSYTLTVNSIGKGSVAKNPDQIKYDSASTIKLTAVPAIWYSYFSSWSGNASGSANPLLVTMNSNKTMTATFLEISISSMIDSLVAFKHRAQSNGWIGDDNFVKELDNGLDNAKKHLAKGDSVNCGKEVVSFQDKIQKEYSKNSKSKDKRFVTEEGYNLFYNNAQYIIDRLLVKK